MATGLPGLVLAAAVGLAFACAGRPQAARAAAHADSADDEAFYQARYAKMMGGQDFYDLLEPIAGVRDLQPLPAAQTPTVASSALKAARVYAAVNNSQAFLVWRDGGLEAADYFGGSCQRRPGCGWRSC